MYLTDRWRISVSIFAYTFGTFWCLLFIPVVLLGVSGQSRDLSQKISEKCASIHIIGDGTLVLYDVFKVPVSVAELERDRRKRTPRGHANRTAHTRPRGP
jgi:hypothetical protein